MMEIWVILILFFIDTHPDLCTYCTFTFRSEHSNSQLEKKSSNESLLPVLVMRYQLPYLMCNTNFHIKDSPLHKMLSGTVNMVVFLLNKPSQHANLS